MRGQQNNQQNMKEARMFGVGREANEHIFHEFNYDYFLL